ncbi:SpoIIE family protein phosphatase [Streptomyces sp. NPDC127069]|uniref:SpoIIE family protein phosphatase n=1 Tax=Streptomyces sp. NPDC127069 TaxID=3347128 RepID=UPI0036643D44
MPSDQPGGARASGPIMSEPGPLLEQVPVAVFGLDAAGRVRYWGPGAEDLFGYGAATALSRPAAALFPAPPEGPGPAERLAERALALGYWRARLPVLHRDGTVLDCGFRVFPLTGSADADADDATVVMALASRGEELDRVKTNLAFLDALFETCPIGLVMLDEELRYVHLNQALADMDGIPVAGHLGRDPAEIMITADGGEFRRMLSAVADEGRPLVGVLVGMRTPGRPDVDQVRSVSLFPLSGTAGSRAGVGGLLVDVTDRERALLEATAARRRLALLDRAGALIGTTLDVDTTARELVEAVMPDFCDGSVVEMVEWTYPSEAFDPDLPLSTRRIASGTVLPPPAPGLLAALDRVTYPPGSGIHRMLSTGRPLCVRVDEEFAARTAGHRDLARQLLDSGVGWVVIAPLIARGHVQGITVFARAATRPAFTEQDLGLAGELASRAALCLDNARLYSRVQDISLTLQRALLPTAPDTTAQVDVAHRYLPGSRATEVGGDWYDVIALPDGRVALVVGDVMGHGVPAAASMGRLHITARALARHCPDPEGLLAELDAAAQDTGIELATCLYVVYDPRTGRARLANAGHPPLLVRHPDGTVETLGDLPGVPLGVGGVPFRSTRAELPDGAVLALYTDGLVEARGQDIDAGLDALRTELARAAGPLEQEADRILAALLPDGATDDTVLVLARLGRTRGEAREPYEEPGVRARHAPDPGR